MKYAEKRQAEAIVKLKMAKSEKHRDEVLAGEAKSKTARK